MNRRSFLKASTAVAAPWVVPSTVFSNPPSDRLVHACIGVDGMGWSDLSSLASHRKIQIVAICDVDLARLGRATERLPQARRYQDWRELLATEGDRIDSVNVTVPDHMHAPISLAALQAGKHVYCQKPLAHAVGEARAMRDTAHQHGVVTQMGNQIQSASVYRTAVRMIQDGMIGRVEEIHAWTGAVFPQRGRPEGSDPIPVTLDWDKWLGSAKPRPYKKGIYHPFNWRGWIDFGGGAIGDFGCHILDTPFKALELTAPTSIRAEVPLDWADNRAWNQENWPVWEIIHYEFPATRYTTGGSLPVTWYDGEKRPPRELFKFDDPERKLPGGGALFVGEQGRLLLPHVGPPEITAGEAKGAPRPDVDGFDHYHAFVDACLGNGSTESHFGFAGPLAEATLLGTIAVRLPGQKLTWQATSMQLDNAAAQAMVHPVARTGW